MQRNLIRTIFLEKNDTYRAIKQKLITSLYINLQKNESVLIRFNADSNIMAESL